MTTFDPMSAITMSPSVVSQTMVGDLNSDQTNLASLENQISTGFAINQPSDNPEGAADLLQLNQSLTRYTQYQTNASDADGWLQTGNNTLNTVLNVLQTVKSTVESVSGTNIAGGSDALSSLAAQVQNALSEITDLANTTYENGQPIFGGTGSSTSAYDATGTYQGAGSAPTRTVAPGTQISVSLTGPEVFGSGTTGLLSQTPGALGVLAQIASDLTSGTPSAVSNLEGSDLTNLDSAIQTVTNAASTLGASQDAVQQFSTQAASTVDSLQQQLGSIQDVNMATAISNLQLQQTAYQAALWATSQLSTDNLAQYL
jgi:flagellar hook-associated protein 3 FlgL